MNFNIIGTGCTLPALSVTNNELSNRLDTSDDWIVSKTGISERRILSNETLLQLAITAAQKAIENALVQANEIDMVIFSTICGDYHTPSMACAVASALGINRPAFDINAACSGFIYALDVAEGYFARKKVNKVLVVSAEQMSRHLDWSDRATCVLFGDGAAAAVLSSGDGLLSIKLTASPNIDIMKIPFVGGNSPFNNREYGPSFLRMNGQEVYKFAVSSAYNDIESVVRQAGLTYKDVSYVLLHQANLRIIHAIRDKIGIDDNKFLTCIQRTGNISSATLPILLDEANREGRFSKGDVLVLSAFGGGLTTGAAVIRWNK